VRPETGEATEGLPESWERDLMIGMVPFACRGGHAVAVLGGDGSWSCTTGPRMSRALAIHHVYSPNWGGLPAGRQRVKAAARWLKGTVIFGAGRSL